jgi:hypothetical protein
LAVCGRRTTTTANWRRLKADLQHDEPCVRWSSGFSLRRFTIITTPVKRPWRLSSGPAARWPGQTPLRRGKVDREAAKQCITFLGQAMGISLHKRLRQVNDQWNQSRDDAALIGDVAILAEEFSKGRPQLAQPRDVRREDLELICCDYVTA